MEKEKEQHQRAHTPVKDYKIEDLKLLDSEDLAKIVSEYEIESPREFHRQELTFEILKAQTKKGGFILFTGILEISSEGYGFLRGIDSDLSDSVNNAYVPDSQIHKFALRMDDMITGQIRGPKDQEKYYTLLKIGAINCLSLQEAKEGLLFDNLTSIFPTEKIKLEYDAMKLTGRILDLLTPIGKGQRGLIVAPPRAGKAKLTKGLTSAIAKNHPEMHLVVLLVDERPREVADMQRCVKGEASSSTFDLPAYNHVHVAELVIEKARRMVKTGKNIIILLDSITRLARAYNTTTPSSGKVLNGGVDANALHKPKHLFGVARDIESGGPLTMVAAALIDTDSRMDDVISGEFRGTGNSEIVLDRNISDRRIYPAINIIKSGTRKEEFLQEVAGLQKIRTIRSVVSRVDDIEALKSLYSKILKTKDNVKLLSIMNEQGCFRP